MTTTVGVKRMTKIISESVPWEYGEEAATYMAKYLNAKHRLMPYIYYHVRSMFVANLYEGLMTETHRLCKVISRAILYSALCSSSSFQTELRILWTGMSACT
jgi:hypothetical protein